MDIETVVFLYRWSFILLIVNFMVVMVSVMIVRGPPPIWTAIPIFPLTLVMSITALVLMVG